MVAIPVRKTYTALRAALLEACDLAAGTAVAFMIAFVPLGVALLLLHFLPFDPLSSIALGLDRLIDSGRYVFFVLLVAAVMKLADRRIEEEATFSTAGR